MDPIDAQVTEVLLPHLMDFIEPQGFPMWVGGDDGLRHPDPTWADWEILRVFFFSTLSSSPSRAFSTIHSQASIAFRDSLMGHR